MRVVCVCVSVPRWRVKHVRNRISLVTPMGWHFQGKHTRQTNSHTLLFSKFAGKNHSKSSMYMCVRSLLYTMFMCFHFISMFYVLYVSAMCNVCITVNMIPNCVAVHLLLHLYLPTCFTDANSIEATEVFCATSYAYYIHTHTHTETHTNMYLNKLPSNERIIRFVNMKACRHMMQH